MVREENRYNMNPLIYYRIAKPVKDLSSLPLIDLGKFYQRSSSDKEYIKFSLKELSLTSSK
jgi:hypothetical protein